MRNVNSDVVFVSMNSRLLSGILVLRILHLIRSSVLNALTFVKYEIP